MINLKTDWIWIDILFFNVREIHSYKDGPQTQNHQQEQHGKIKNMCNVMNWINKTVYANTQFCITVQVGLSWCKVKLERDLCLSRNLISCLNEHLKSNLPT